MKKVSLQVSLIILIAFGIGCNGNSSTTVSDTSSVSKMDTTTTVVDNSKMSGSATDTMPANDTSSKKNDQSFVLGAGSGGMMEVELGKIAQTNASSAKVKDFGNMMVTDHSKANTELKNLAAKKGIVIPEALKEKEQMHVSDLKTKNGADFDKAYVNMMVDDHKEDISKFEDEVKNGKDADVKAFAIKTLPTLKKHLQAIVALQAGMK